MMELVPLIDADSFAYDRVMKVRSMPIGTPEQEAARDAAMEAELKKAAEVPMNTVRVANSVWDTLLELAEFGSLNAKSDLEIAARALELAVWGAQRNVAINLEDVKDKEFAEKLLKESEAACELARVKSVEVCNKIHQHELDEEAKKRVELKSVSVPVLKK